MRGTEKGSKQELAWIDYILNPKDIEPILGRVRRGEEILTHLLCNTIPDNVTTVHGRVGTINYCNFTISLQINQGVFQC